MCFGVLIRYTEVKYVGIQNNTFIRYFKIFNLVVFFGINHVFFVGGQRFAKMHIIGIAAEALPVVRNDFNSAFFYFFQYPCVRKYHVKV